MSTTETLQIESCLMRMLPQGFAMAITDRCVINGFSLHPREEECLSSRATTKRRTEFIMGRAAAHAALAKLGKSVSGIGKGKSGAPLWPQGIVGSITHKDDAAVAIVAPARLCRGIGVDLESITVPIEPDISRRICHPEEIPWVVENRTMRAFRLRLIFSAKESVFKSVNSFNGAVIPFSHIRLRWDQKQKSFDIALPEMLHETLSCVALSPVCCGILSHSVVTLFVLW